MTMEKESYVLAYFGIKLWSPVAYECSKTKRKLSEVDEVDYRGIESDCEEGSRNFER